MKFELRSVRIKGCGPIDDIKIEFFDETGKTLPVCVIGGSNGSGKTTVLESIAALAQVLTNTIPPYFTAKNPQYAQMDMLIGESPISVCYGHRPDDAVIQQEYVFFESVEGRPNLMTRQTALGKQITKRISQQQSTNTNGHQPMNEDETIPSLLFLPWNRSLEPVSSDQVRKEATSYQFAHRFSTVREFPGSLNSYLIWLDYAEPEKFVSAQRFLNSLDFDGKTFHIQRQTLDIMVHTTQGREHQLHDLSSGEQNILIVLLELRRRLLPHSIVLIDEIENSLHPAFQHRLAQGLLALQRETPFQLIATTHAPIFVEIFGAEATRILTPF